MKNILAHKSRLFLFFVIILGFILRFNRLTEIPYGFYQDETAIGYNAYSILQTGKDEYGIYYPLYFKSFGDYKLPSYIYMTAISEKIFGLNEFAVRFPSALFGSLSVIILYLVILKLTENKKIAVLSSLFLAINPWHLQFSRAGFEVNLALFFALLGTWSFLKLVKDKNISFYIILCVLSFSLSLYSYNVTRLLSPLIILILIIYNYKAVKKIPDRYLIFSILLFLFLLSPFLITFLQPFGVASAKGALITSNDIQAKIIEFRSYLVNLPGIFGTLFFNKWIMLVWQYFENLVTSLSTNFFFVSGSLHGNQGIGNAGLFYLFQFPLVIAGFVLILKDKLKQYYFFVYWAIICFLVMGLSKEVPHATRGFFIVIPFQVFSALGFMYFWKMKVINYKLRILFLLFSGLLIFFNIMYYLTSYYYKFPVQYAKSWRSEDKTLSLYLKQNEHKYARIIFDNSAGFMYTSLLFYLPYPPGAFQGTAVRFPDDSEGFSVVKSFGKYEFKDVDWQNDYKNKSTLIVTTSGRKPNEVPPLITFYYPRRPVVFSVKEKIMEYPIEEIAYVLVESK